MFGNKLGWGISAVLAVSILLMARWINGLNQVSPPSKGIVTRTGNVELNLADRPELLEPIKLPFSPESVYPAMTEAKDAAESYRQVIDFYNADKETYDRLIRGKPRSMDYQSFPALELLVKARTASSMNLYQSRPQQVINYHAHPAGIEALAAVGKGAINLALYLADEKPQEAQALAEAAFSLGVKLANERLRWYEFQVGVELMRDGANVIARVDPSRKAAAKEAEAQLQTAIKQRWMPLWIVISSIDPGVVGRTGGDIFYIARNSQERMWRIEAVLKMGRYKYEHGEPGRAAHKRWAEILTRRMAVDQSLDPAVRLAAEAARDLTREQYLMLGAM